jgi:hypothetical protein
VIQSVNDLVRRRFLICDDTQDIISRLLQAGENAGVPAPKKNEDTSTPVTVQACQGHMPPHYHYNYHFEGDGHGNGH